MRGLTVLFAMLRIRCFRKLVNKADILRHIIATLNAELAALTRAANDAFAAATDPDSKAENKYDTRNLEASYVARGQAKRVAELQEAVHAMEALPAQPLEAGIMGALVSLEAPEGITHYLLAPAAGGTEIVHEGNEVVVITPASPLGQKLAGRRAGESILLRPGVMAMVVAVR